MEFFKKIVSNLNKPTIFYFFSAIKLFFWFCLLFANRFEIPILPIIVNSATVYVNMIQYLLQ